MDVMKEKITKFLEWFSTFCLISGAVATATNFIPLNVVLFLLGSSGWTIVGIMWNKKSLIILNGVLTLIYVAGLIWG